MLFFFLERHIYMNAEQTALARKHLERRLGPLRDLNLVPPPKGWLRAIRESLGMTARQLAARMGTVPSRIPVIEEAEITGATTVKTLRQAAAAMNCAFVYAFVPIEPLDEIVRERAIRKARAEIARLDHTMRLENQSLRKIDLDAEARRAIDRLLAGSPRRLWSDDKDDLG